MQQLDIELGFTHSDRANDYIPMQDGYRPGAAQTKVTLGPVTVDNVNGRPVTGSLDLEQAETVAEACFGAMNRPGSSPGPLERAIKTAIEQVLEKMRHACDPGLDHVHTLSVGDTVTVNGLTMACASRGWETV